MDHVKKLHVHSASGISSEGEKQPRLSADAWSLVRRLSNAYAVDYTYRKRKNWSQESARKV